MAKKPTTIAKVAADNVINAAESAAGVSVTGTTDAGSKVVLDGLKATMLSPTNWKVLLTADQIKAFGQGPEVLKAVTTNQAGKTSSVTQAISVDTLAPKAAEITGVAADPSGSAAYYQDSYVNAAESRKSVLLNGRSEPGSIVTVNGKAVVQYSPTAWQLELTPAQIKAYGQGDEILKIAAADKAGNQTLGNYTLHVDTVAPKPAVFDKTAQNNVIDGAERQAGVTVSGSNEAGASVTLNGWRTVAVSPTHWQIELTAANFKALGTGGKTLKAVATDAAGNQSTATQTITIDAQSTSVTPDGGAPAPATITEVQSSLYGDSAKIHDNVIDADESKLPFWLIGDKAAGSSVKVNGKAVMALSPTQWMLKLTAKEIQAFGAGEEVLQIVATNAAGKKTTSTYTLTVDTQAVSASEPDSPGPAPAIVTSVQSMLNTGLATDRDDVINIEEIQEFFWLQGKKEAGSSVTVDGKPATPISPTQWILALTPEQIQAFGPGEETLQIVATDAAGEKTASTYTLIVDLQGASAPAPAQITRVWSAVDTGWAMDYDDVINAAESKKPLWLTGENEAGSSVTVDGKAVTPFSPTQWTLKLSPEEIQAFGEGEQVLQIVATNIANQKTTSTYTLTVDTQNSEVPKSTAITGVWSDLTPASGWNGDNFINARELQKPFWLYGENEPGSKVTVNGKAVKQNDATTWQLKLLPADLKAFGEGEEALKIVTTDGQGKKTESSYRLTVDSQEPASPVIDPVATDNIVDGDESLQGITIGGSNAPGVSMDFNGWVVEAVSDTRWKIDIAPWSMWWLGSGPQTITATATDEAGNQTTTRQTLIIDLPLETVTQASQNAAAATDTQILELVPATIDVVAGDDVIDAAESQAGVTVTGGKGKGDRVVLNGWETQALSDTRWEYALTPAQVAELGEGAKFWPVYAYHQIGGSSISYQVVTIDTQAPPVLEGYTLPVTADNIVNAQEAAAGVTVDVYRIMEGTQITVDGLPTRAATDGGLIWQAWLTPEQIRRFGEGEATLAIATTDQAGNSVSFNQVFWVDTLAPEAAGIDAVAGDDVVNAQETEVGVQLTGSKAAGSTVKLQGMAKDIVAYALSDTTWGAWIAPETLAAWGEGSYTLEVETEDAAGNSTRSERNFSISLRDVAAPTIDRVAGDHTINAQEAATGVVLSGGNEAGSRVTVYDWAGQWPASPVTDSSWQITLSPAQIAQLDQGWHTWSIVATNEAGNTATSYYIMRIDTLAPAAATLDSVATDDIINAEEAAAGVTISGDKEAGSTVTVDGLAATSVSATRWSLNLTQAQIEQLGQGDKTLAIIATDNAGNAASNSHALRIDTQIPQGPATDDVAGDNVIDVSESAAGITITGSNEAGATVTVAGLPVVAVTPTTWRISLTPEQIGKKLDVGATVLPVETTDAAGNSNSISKIVNVAGGDAPYTVRASQDGQAIHKIQLTITANASAAQDLVFQGLASGCSVYDQAGRDVSAGISGFTGQAVYTLVLPADTDQHFDLSVLPAGGGTASSANTVAVALDSAARSDALLFDAQDQNLWNSGGNAGFKFHEYIPLLGTESAAWKNSVKLVDAGIGDSLDFGLDTLVPFQQALDSARDALNSVNSAFDWAKGLLDAAQSEYDNGPWYKKAILWVPLKAARLAYDIARDIYDDAYPAAQNGLNQAQAAYDAQKEILKLEYKAGLELSADLKGKVGIAVDFSGDAGSVDFALDYTMTTRTSYNQTTDSLYILPSMVNNTGGDQVAFTTQSPNVKFGATIKYDVGANVHLGGNAYAKALGNTLIDSSFKADIPVAAQGEYKVVDFNSTSFNPDVPTDPYRLPVLHNLTKGVLSAYLDVPSLAVQGKSTAYDSSYFQEGGLVSVNFEEIADALFNFLNANIQLNPEWASVLGQQTIDGVLTSLWQAITAGNNVVTQKPVFIMDATDYGKSALFHVNSYGDDLSTLNAHTGSLGFYMGYGKTDNFVKVNIDLDQLAALVGNLIATGGVMPPVIVNPLDQVLNLAQILSFADVSGATASLLQEFFDVEFEIGAVDADVSQNANFGQEFSLSVDDMDYVVTLEDNAQFKFALNDGKGLTIPNASLHDADQDGLIEYSLKIAPDAMFSNDTELGLNMGYQLDFFKSMLAVDFGQNAIKPVQLFSGSIGPLLRVQGSMDQLAIDVYEKRFPVDVGTEIVAMTGIGYQDGTMFT
ncbi:MAG: hypothetical protein EPN21_05315 [Methylococcaceae bacterium]|nr:MAG: hypothetical protein EPN21_05315 [Methylococcaceae bacterium]